MDPLNEKFIWLTFQWLMQKLLTCCVQPQHKRHQIHVACSACSLMKSWLWFESRVLICHFQGSALITESKRTDTRWTRYQMDQIPDGPDTRWTRYQMVGNCRLSVGHALGILSRLVAPVDMKLSYSFREHKPPRGFQRQ